MNAIGTQWRDPINSGLTRWRLAVLNIIMDVAAEIGRNPVSNVTAGKCNWRHFGWSVRLVGFPQCYLTCRFLTNKIFYLIQGAGGVSE